MSHNNHSRTGPRLQAGRPPWLVFLFLAVVFFLSQHDMFYSNKINETSDLSYDLSKDETVAMLDEGSLSHRLAVLSLGLFAVGSLIRHRGARLQINGSLGWTLLFFAGWTVLSLVWADDAAQTLRRLVVFAILCLVAAVIARRFSLHEIVLWTSFTTGLYLLIGVAAEIALGTFRPFASGYRFAGTMHPNFQGINCALLLLSSVAAADTEKRRRILFRACALLGLVFLILTGSRTSFAAALLALAVYLVLVCSRATKIAMAYALSMAFCLLLLFLVNGLLPNLKAAIMLGRDDSSVDSLNGRTGVWGEVIQYIYQRPILGYGYGGFWNQRHIAEISDTEKWGVAASHSIYLECLLDLGSVGLAAYVFALLGGIARSFALYRASQAPAYAIFGAILIFCLANGLLESATLWSESVTFLIMAVLIKLGFRGQDFSVRGI